MASPFLKWAGGKRWLADSRRLPIPETYNRYIEPFVGGGAVFFHLRPSDAILSDINEELIELYRVMRDEPNKLFAELERHQASHSKDHYYSVRESSPEQRIAKAARTLYLNRTCWNGLYRVNLRGDFNVPIGTKDTVIFEGEDFSVFSEALQNAEIFVTDFEASVNRAEEGDFLFIDPPYTVKHNFNGFLKYNERIFSWADQIRLRDSLSRAIQRGAAVVVTNADHASVRELYEGLCDYQQLDRFSVLSGTSLHRGKTTEALFVANLG